MRALLYADPFELQGLYFELESEQFVECDAHHCRDQEQGLREQRQRPQRGGHFDVAAVAFGVADPRIELNERRFQLDARSSLLDGAHSLLAYESLLLHGAESQLHSFQWIRERCDSPVAASSFLVTLGSEHVVGIASLFSLLIHILRKG